MQPVDVRVHNGLGLTDITLYSRPVSISSHVIFYATYLTPLRFSVPYNQWNAYKILLPCSLGKKNTPSLSIMTLLFLCHRCYSKVTGCGLTDITL